MDQLQSQELQAEGYVKSSLTKESIKQPSMQEENAKIFYTYLQRPDVRISVNSKKDYEPQWQDFYTVSHMKGEKEGKRGSAFVLDPSQYTELMKNSKWLKDRVVLIGAVHPFIKKVECEICQKIKTFSIHDELKLFYRNIQYKQSYEAEFLFPHPQYFLKQTPDSGYDISIIVLKKLDSEIFLQSREEFLKNYGKSDICRQLLSKKDLDFFNKAKRSKFKDVCLTGFPLQVFRKNPQNQSEIIGVNVHKLFYDKGQFLNQIYKWTKKVPINKNCFCHDILSYKGQSGGPIEAHVKNCKENHNLYESKTSDNIQQCNICKEFLLQGSSMIRCRNCDYGCCKKCYVDDLF